MGATGIVSRKVLNTFVPLTLTNTEINYSYRIVKSSLANHTTPPPPSPVPPPVLPPVPLPPPPPLLPVRREKFHVPRPRGSDSSANPPADAPVGLDTTLGTTFVATLETSLLGVVPVAGAKA